MSGEQLFQNQRAPWLTVDKTAEVSVDTPPNAGDVRLFVDTADDLLKMKDDGGTATEVGGTTALASHVSDTTSAHTAEGVDIVDAGGIITATNVEAALQEIQGALDTEEAALVTHEGAADPHTGYRLESADHTHQSTGAEAGQLDHGLALTGLGDDDHPQYIKDAEFTAADTVLLGTGAGTFTELQHGFSKTTAPGVSDDNTAGWAVGSNWIDTTGDTMYVALDVTTGAAVWQEVGAGGGGASALGDLSDVTVSGSETLGQSLQSDGAGGFAFDDQSGGGGGTASITHEYLGAQSPGGTAFNPVAATWYMRKITVSGSGVITSGAFYQKMDASSVGGQPQMALWDDGGSGPDRLIAVGRPDNAQGMDRWFTRAAGADPHWVDIPLSVYVEAGDYWVGIMIGADVETDLYYDALVGTGWSYAPGGTWTKDMQNGTEGSSNTNDYSLRVSFLAATVTGATTLPVDSVAYTAGNFLPTATSPTWEDSSIEVTVAADAGDVLQVAASAIGIMNGTNICRADVATIVSSSQVNYVSGGSTNGLPGLRVENIAADDIAVGGAWQYTVQAGDISGGNVTLRVVGNVTGGSTAGYGGTSTEPFMLSVVNLKAAGSGGGLKEGTAFPTGPATGDRYRRTDLDYEIYFYDGTRWLSETRYTLASQFPFDSTSAASFYGGMPFDDAGQDVYVEDIEFQCAVKASHDGSNFYTIDLYQIDAGGSGGAGEVIVTYNTDDEAPGAGVMAGRTIAVDAVMDVSTDSVLAWYIGKTGSPGTHRGWNVAHYRLIAT